MNVENNYIIELNQAEAEALKTILGKQSTVERREMGLSEEQCASMSELWGLLAFTEDDEA